MTDDGWAIIKPLIPPAKRGGNKRTVDVREVVNGLMYILSTGCAPPQTRGAGRPSRRRCAPRRCAGSRPMAACDGAFYLPLAF